MKPRAAASVIGGNAPNQKLAVIVRFYELVVPANAGTHTPRPLDFERSELALFETITVGGYGSPDAQLRI